MADILPILATTAGVVSMIGYIPQVTHLVKVKNSEGISILAWSSWFVCNVVLLIYALSIKSIPYAIVEILSCLANLTVIFLTLKYKNKETK